MKHLVIVYLLLFVSGVISHAQPEKRIREFNIDKSSLALDGYDPVAYFTAKRAIEGKNDITTVFEGIRYRFATRANKERFVASPALYEPQ